MACKEHFTYPIFRTRFASSKKSLRLVPMSERQNTATFTESDESGVWAILHAMTRLFAATKSKL